MIEKKCYFFNVGTTFDKNDFEMLKDVWNCNPNCCKSDLCNGLWCENFGIDFNKEQAIKHIKRYVEKGVNNTYGYIKEVSISLPEDLWKDIYTNLVKDYHFKNISDAKKDGYIPFEYAELIDDFSSYWEEPDISFWKDNGDIKQNAIHILKESELNSETINWVNDNLYPTSKENEIGEI